MKHSNGRLMLEIDEDTKQVRLVWVFDCVYHAMLLHDLLEGAIKKRGEVHLNLTLVPPDTP